jgi:hypothetical protein
MKTKYVGDKNFLKYFKKFKSLFYHIIIEIQKVKYSNQFFH